MHADDGPSHAHNPFFALERFGFPGAMWHSLHRHAATQEREPYDEELMLESNGELAHMLQRSDGPTPGDIELAGRYALARATQSRLQNDLREAGLL